MKPFGLWLGICLLTGLTGCTARQLYASGQSWQRNQCFRLVDTVQRKQCLARTWMPYDQYKRELRADAASADSGPL